MSEPLLVRAARLEPTERTPVWFMRQAGRSLPEYREIRKTHTLFEVCYEPELCAEVTLQPVRRHDVDAAVMFADIMLPLLGMGVNVELVENVGPVIEQPIRSLADVEKLTVPRAGGVGAVHPRGRLDRAPRAAPRPGRDRLLRRAVHRRRLPDRGQAEPGVPEREADDVRRAGDLARADGEAHRRLLPLRRGEGARGRGRDPALRLVGGRALAAGLRGVRAAVLGAHPRRGRLPDDPLRHRHGDAARADARRGRRRDRARLADPARLGLAAGRRRPRRPGQPRRRRPLRAVGADRGGDAGRARPRGRPAGPHLQPRPRRHARHRPDVLGRLRAFVHEQTLARPA